jgi:bleomycin hydrolase
MRTRTGMLMAAVCAAAVGACEQHATPVPPDAGTDAAAGPAAPARRVVEISGPLLKDAAGVATARYETVFHDPVLEELRAKDMTWKDDQASETGKVTKAQEDRKEKERLEEKELLSSLPPEEIPPSIDIFSPVKHLPPVPQYYTGTCWSFATTSFMESEAARITGKEVKLSEMATVYWEYLAKASRFIRERGDSFFSEGSEASALTRIWKEQGAWPLEAYPGVASEDKRHDHQRLFREMNALLESFKSQGLWDEQAGLAMLRVILDRHLGQPPGSFSFNGAATTPKAFMEEVLKVRPDDYVSVMSTLSVPFFTQGELKVPDNWWHDASYYNVPLEEFFGALKGAIGKGYSLTVAVDYSEPGKDAENDVMFIPDYDIPAGHIDQLAREYRLASNVTTDDHGVHLIGHASFGGHDWFLVKDSSRSALRGKHKGYFFLRDDYVMLKVLSFTVHKDAVADLLSKFPAASPP